MKKLLRQLLLLIAVVAIAICLLWPRLSKKDKFPYVGVWQGSRMSSGEFSILGFNNDGSCTYARSSAPPSACSYEMRESKAFITMATSKRDGITILFRVPAVPQNGGQTLEFTEIDAADLYPSGKQTNYARFTDPAYTLRKVK